MLAGLLVCLLGVSAVPAATNVACAGDSNTFGSGIPVSETYPAKLQRLLGPGYNVANYGAGGTTLLKSGDSPYWNSTAFMPSHGNPTPPDIVIIMLGSNDSKPQNWQFGSNFFSNYTELIATYTNLPTHPRVLLCTPPPVYGSGAFSINPGIVATNIAPVVRLLGSDLGHELIDLNARLAGHAEWFPDNVHPNISGTTVVAAIIYSALQGDTMNGAIPSLSLTLPSNNRAVLRWPAGGAGWVPQSASGLGGTNSWVVVFRPAISDGTSILCTNLIPAGGTAMFRLWRPAN